MQNINNQANTRKIDSLRQHAFFSLMAFLLLGACTGSVGGALSNGEVRQIEGTEATLVSGEQLYIDGARLFNAATTFRWEQLSGPAIPIADPSAPDLLVTAPEVSEATFVVLNLQVVTSGASASVLFTIAVIPDETGSEAVCGDNICDSSEACDTCSADCDRCADPEPTCGDNVCDSSEACDTCSADCGQCADPEPTCGDNICDSSEACDTCSADCGVCQDNGGLQADFGPTKNLWVSRSTLLGLQTSGGAWDDIAADAMSNWGSANISDQNSDHNVLTFAGALYAVRMNDTSMRDKVVASIEEAMGTEDDSGSDSRTLALGRNLLAYVLAADLVGYRTVAFEQWLSEVRHRTLSGRTLVSTHEDRPNNWGTHAGASRMGVALFLGDTQDMEAAIDVFKGYLGDRAAYADFKYGDLTWQADPDKPVGVNPMGATINGLNVDGVLPDDQRRCECSVSLPFDNENYAYEAMQGVFAQAFLVSNYLRNKGQDGSDVFGWQDEAIRRAWVWLNLENDFPAEGDDKFQTYLMDAAYGTSYRNAVSSTTPGKSIGYTDWTHAR